MKKKSNLPVILIAAAVAVAGIFAVIFLVKAMQLGRKPAPAESSSVISEADSSGDSDGSRSEGEPAPGRQDAESGSSGGSGGKGGESGSSGSSEPAPTAKPTVTVTPTPSAEPTPTGEPVPTVVPSAVATVVSTGPPEAIFALKPEKVKTATASSSYGADSSGKSDYGPEKAADGDVTTTWMEGSGKSGSGEYLKLVLEQPVEVRYIALYLGNWKGYEAFDDNSRPEVLTLYLGGQSFQLTFGDFPTGQYIVFDKPVKTEDLTISIDKVYQGPSGGCCISEVEIYAQP